MASRVQPTSEASGPPPRPQQALVPILVIALAGAAVYSNTFRAPFHWDDLPNIVRNESLRDLRSLWPPSGTRWLGNVSFALNYALGGLDVFGYHVANLLVHVCNALLVFWLASTTLRTPALRRAEAGPLVRRHLPLAAGVLFVVHPVQTQAVTYVVQRYASLATLFFLLSVVLYARARLSMEEERPSRARAAALYALSVGAAAAAMKTKEISFTLPIVVALYELIFFAPRRRWVLLAPIAATALLVPLALATQGRDLGDVLGDAGRVAAETPNVPRSVYLLTQARVIVTYLRLLVFPVGQNLDYDFRLSDSPTDPAFLLSAGVLLTIVAFTSLLLVRAREANRTSGVVIFFGVAWFFITLSVESSVIPIRDVIFEHRMYLPSAGASVAIATAILSALELLRWRVSPGRQVAIVLLLTAAPFAIATHERNTVWLDDATLWRDVVSKSPDKARAHVNLGFAYKEKAKLDDAIREYREAIRLDPSLAQAHNNLGAVYQARGDLAEAAREFREAVRLDASSVGVPKSVASAPPGVHPDPRARAIERQGQAVTRLAEAHDRLCRAYRAIGRQEDAAREFSEAVRLAPALAEADRDPCFGSRVPGVGEKAAPESAEPTRDAPGLAEAHGDLGLAYKANGQLEEAVREFREAIRVSPGTGEARTNLGNALKAQGRLDDAARELREAIRVSPRLAEPHNSLGNIHKARGELDDAIREYVRAIGLNARPEFVLNLAVTLDDAGRSAEAAPLYRRFLDMVGDADPYAERVKHRLAELGESSRAPVERPGP